MSKLTDAQLAAAIAGSEATAAKHEANGDVLHAAAARGRAHRNRAELARRQYDAGAAVDRAPAELPTRPDITPGDAVRAAEDLVSRWGGGAAVRALQIALSQALAPKSVMDVAEGVRLLQMRRKARA